MCVRMLCISRQTAPQNKPPDGRETLTVCLSALPDQAGQGRRTPRGIAAGFSWACWAELVARPSITKHEVR